MSLRIIIWYPNNNLQEVTKMPGTGMSLARFISLGVWLVLFFWVSAVAVGGLYRIAPNAITAALVKAIPTGR